LLIGGLCAYAVIFAISSQDYRSRVIFTAALVIHPIQYGSSNNTPQLYLFSVHILAASCPEKSAKDGCPVHWVRGAFLFWSYSRLFTARVFVTTATITTHPFLQCIVLDNYTTPLFLLFLSYRLISKPGCVHFRHCFVLDAPR
jgi:hypothetical protein